MKRPILTQDRISELNSNILNGAFHSNPWKQNKHKYKQNRLLRRTYIIISSNQIKQLSGATKRWFNSLLMRSNTREMHVKTNPTTREKYYVITDYLTIAGIKKQTEHMQTRI